MYDSFQTLANKIVSSVLTILLVSSAYAQTDRLELGVQSGVNITSLHGENFSRYFAWHFSAIGSIRAQYHFNDAFSIVSDIAYESKGCKGVNLKLLNNEGTSIGSNYSFEYAIDYVTIPLLFRYSAPRSAFFINAGPYLGYLLKYTENMGTYTIDRTNDMSKMDWGASLGLGLSFHLSDNVNLSFELRNNFGLANIYQNNNAYQTSAVRPAFEINPITTNSTNVLMGISYRLE
jgi:hypothetical protein